MLKIDPNAEFKINSNDTQRTIRAYEVIKYTGKSLFEWFKSSKKNFEDDEFIKVYIDYPREKLIRRINNRINLMIKLGAVKEVDTFLKLKVKDDLSSNKIIGIREITQYLRKVKNLSSTKDEISIKTRQYAKRQATWARGQMKDWHKIKNFNEDAFIKIINS